MCTYRAFLFSEGAGPDTGDEHKQTAPAPPVAEAAKSAEGRLYITNLPFTPRLLAAPHRDQASLMMLATLGAQTRVGLVVRGTS